ncbi:NYN domain-containing protein [Palleronia rufa]|uniref:NYN domain-containing protein n=1 Tax=Palleronia rufa TaxID=1530186 RepID=UPI001376A925|nr:NYN domain-containing protein [Palleronia rufa]
MKKVHVFWDNSNIFVGAQAAFRSLGKPFPYAARIDFHNLYRLAVVGRPVGGAFCVGSVPPELAAVWKRLEKATGIVPELFERGAETNREQAVDQALQVHMLRAMTDTDEPGTAILMTGDGAGYLNGVGFHADLERMHKKGWGIEVLSWEVCCNSRMQEWAETVGVFVKLEDYMDQIVFEQSVTNVPKINLKGRPTV